MYILLIFAREDGSPWKPDHVYRQFRKVAAAAGLPVLSPHPGARHTGNSLMRDAGVDETVRMREVGHVTKTVSDRYTHTLAEQHRQGAEATARLVDGAGS
jgi:integrase